jgi:hypothetical protein
MDGRLEGVKHQAVTSWVDSPPGEILVVLRAAVESELLLLLLQFR